MAHAFRGFCSQRRRALWKVQRALKALPGPLRLERPPEQARVELRRMTAAEEIHADYHSTGLSPRLQPLAPLRARLAKQGVCSARDLERRTLPAGEPRARGGARRRGARRARDHPAPAPRARRRPRAARRRVPRFGRARERGAAPAAGRGARPGERGRGALPERLQGAPGAGLAPPPGLGAAPPARRGGGGAARARVHPLAQSAGSRAAGARQPGPARAAPPRPGW